MEKSRLEANVSNNTTNVIEAKIELQKAVKEWEEVVKNRIEIREKELLDRYDMIIDSDNQKAKR